MGAFPPDGTAVEPGRSDTIFNISLVIHHEIYRSSKHFIFDETLCNPVTSAYKVTDVTFIYKALKALMTRCNFNNTSLAIEAFVIIVRVCQRLTRLHAANWRTIMCTCFLVVHQSRGHPITDEEFAAICPFMSLDHLRRMKKVIIDSVDLSVSRYTYTWYYFEMRHAVKSFLLRSKIIKMSTRDTRDLDTSS